jgi:hypothetical protein
VVESTKSQVLHIDDRQGKVPFCDVEACARELWTRVSRIFLLCRKETKGLSEKVEDVSVAGSGLGRLSRKNLRVLKPS